MASDSQKVHLSVIKKLVEIYDERINVENTTWRGKFGMVCSSFMPLLSELFLPDDWTSAISEVVNATFMLMHVSHLFTYGPDYHWLAAKRLKTTSASITEWMINLQTFWKQGGSLPFSKGIFTKAGYFIILFVTCRSWGVVRASVYSVANEKIVSISSTVRGKIDAGNSYPLSGSPTASLIWLYVSMNRLIAFPCTCRASREEDNLVSREGISPSIVAKNRSRWDIDTPNERASIPSRLERGVC